MAGKVIKNIIPLKTQSIAVYASPKVSAALHAVTSEMTLFQGVRLTQLLEAVYLQGRKDGARSAFEALAGKMAEARDVIPHRNPGKPKKAR